MQFPEGDTLGVVFSFLNAFQLLRKTVFVVCKEWNRVLCYLPHTWNSQLDLRWIHNDIPCLKFAWHRVTRIDFGRSDQVTDVGLANISTLHLQYLICRFASVSNVGLTYLSSMPLLDLSRCEKITDFGLVHISSLLLKYLNLHLCGPITDAGMLHISSMPLQMLILHGSNITDIGLRIISSLPLKYVGLVYCQKVTQTGLACFPKHCFVNHCYYNL